MPPRYKPVTRQVFSASSRSLESCLARNACGSRD
nr:MAG TPA: hypothetical protein [Caudoviricetes sp.]